jgi:hypothetical protein
VWFFVEQPWQYRVLDALPPGVDEAQLERARKLSPSERIDALVELMELMERVEASKAAAGRAKDLVDLEALRVLAKKP